MKNTPRFFSWSILSTSLSVFLLAACSHASLKPVQVVSSVLNESQNANQIAIATSEPLAGDAAAQIFKEGGNLVDAAIAASFAISVVRPQSTGIGGGGFLLFYNAAQHKTEAWDFREIAPQSTGPKTFDHLPENASSRGVTAVGVPGLIAGLYELHRRHGKIAWEKILAPAIHLAGEAIPVSPHLASALADAKDEVGADPELRKIFFRGDRVLQQDETYIQEDLKKTLEAIARDGKKAFYRGDFAQKLSAYMKEHQGFVSAKDLAEYRVKVRAPLIQNYRDYKITTMPPPSSGGVHLLQILKIVDDLSSAYRASHPGLIPEIEAMKRAFFDRAFFLGDPDFVHVPTRELLSEKHLKAWAKEIEAKGIQASADIRPLPMKTEHQSKESQTTHLSFLDSAGNAIATTQSVNGYFGSGVMLPGTGVILNNTMDDFTARAGKPNIFGLVGNAFNRVQPRKRPLSSMTPTLVADQKGQIVFALGTRGGPRIISGVYYVLSRYLRDHESIEKALSGCRFHHQWMPDQITLEPECIHEYPDLEKNYKLKAAPRFLFGEVEVVGKNAGQIFSATDPRGEGIPLVVSRP